MEVQKFILKSAKAVGVSGAVKEILRNNSLIRNAICNYAAWMGPLAQTRDGKPLLATVLGQAVTLYRKLMPEYNEANKAFLFTLEDSFPDCVQNHYVGRFQNGDEIEWDITQGNAVDFMKIHHEVVEWKIVMHPFRNGEDFSDDFYRAIVIQKISAPAHWDKLVDEG